MDTDEASRYAVHTGFWTNWSDGKVHGSTLTLARGNANLLIAFIAFYTTIIFGHVWVVCCFILHSWFSKKGPQDAIYHQRQATLRNNSGPAGTAWTMIRLSWLWRKSTAPSHRRILPLLGFIAVLLYGFVAATGFSSRIASGSEVLLAGSHCGLALRVGQNRVVDIYLPWAARGLTKSANYAQQCYAGNSSSSGPDCWYSPFVRQRLPFSVDADAPCPFDRALCASHSSNLWLDTGFLDSHIDMGINAPQAERFQYRTTLQCAPLMTREFKSDLNSSIDRWFSRYYFGNLVDPLKPISPLSDFTYQYPKKVFAGSNIPLQAYAPDDYSIGTLTAYAVNRSIANISRFDPIPGLWLGDADVTLIFLSTNAVVFMEPTADSWYNSSYQLATGNVQNVEGGLVPFWLADEAASPMACAYREQYCFPGSDGQRNCTLLGSWLDTQIASQALAPNENARQRLKWFTDGDTVLSPYVGTVLERLRADALTARFSMIDGQQGPLPDDQWQRDVIYWQSVMLAARQKSLADMAAGNLPDHPSLRRGPANAEESKLCGSQKTVSPQHLSFNVFRLGILGALGLVIILVSCWVEFLAGCAQKRFKRDPYARFEWYANGTLQLQRLVHEELGFGTWSNCNDAIPLVDGQVHLAELDLSDESHSRLHVCVKEESNGQHGSDTDFRNGSDGTIQSDAEGVNKVDKGPAEQHSRVRHGEGGSPSSAFRLSLDGDLAAVCYFGDLGV